MTGELKHTYPSNYRPGTHWAVDEAWRILDAFEPGFIPDDTRFLIAGQIAGGLMRIVGPRDAEIAHLKQWIADLQSGMYVNCVYCGHRYGPQMTTPVTMADALKEHVAQCSEHPMAKCVETLKAASDALKSYAYGNSSTDLAAEIAQACDLVIGKVTKPASPEARS